MPGEPDYTSLPTPQEIRGTGFRLAFDAISTGLVIVDTAGVIVFVNSAAERMFLYERNRLPGQSIQVLVPPARQPEHAEQVAAFLGNSVRRPMGEATDLSALRSDGSEFPVEIGLSPLPTTGGTWVVASVVDLTAWKRLATTAREEHDRAQAYLEATSEGLVMVEASGAIGMVNKATERIFGYDRSELLGQPLEILIPEARRRTHAEKRERYLAEPKLRPMGLGFDLSGRRKDGTRFPVDVGLNVARIGGRIVAIAFVSDISERRRLQEQASVLGALVDLQQQISTQRKTEPASHDLDPLTGLDTSAMFSLALEKASAHPQGHYVALYSIRHLNRMRSRFGQKLADRVVVFASQFIANSLSGERDQLFRLQGTTFASLVKRDTSLMQFRGEVTDACGKRLEYFAEQTGGTSLVLIVLSVKVLPLAPLAEVVAEIERFSRSETPE